MKVKCEEWHSDKMLANADCFLFAISGIKNMYYTLARQQARKITTKPLSITEGVKKENC